jgi:PAS domain S-box-containing protein
MFASEQPSRLRELLGEVSEAVRARDATVQVLRAVIETLSVPALIADTRGRYVAVNQAAATLTGYTVAELTRLSNWQLTPNASEHDMQILWHAFLSRGEQYRQYPLLTKDNRVVIIEYAACTDVLPGLHLSLVRALP